MIKKKCILVLNLFISLFTIANVDLQAQIPAFPGAEGYGAYALGGRGGVVYEVTNLNDSGPGSFRDACDASGPRIVVFRISGTIDLNDDIHIINPFLTIAGQTAPGDGICLKNASLVISTHDIIVRFIRVRVGDNNGEIDGLALIGTGSPAENVIIDHCSISWAVDENVSTYGDCNDVTFQWCLISEGLYDSVHGDGPHSMGMRIGKSGIQNISVHHCLFANNGARQPQAVGDTDTEIINNVIYNWLNLGIRLRQDARSNIISNHFITGPSTGNEKGVVVEGDLVKAYVSNNIGPGRPTNSGDDWLVVNGNASLTQSLTPVVSQSGITILPVEDILSILLDNVGASLPKRDAVDTRVLQSISNNTGFMLDSPADIGGWPILASATPPSDIDHDGMPDYWETSNGLNPNDPNDRNGDLDGDGYTNIEEYLNELVSGFDNTQPAPPQNLWISK